MPSTGWKTMNATIGDLRDQIKALKSANAELCEALRNFTEAPKREIATSCNHSCGKCATCIARAILAKHGKGV